MEKETVEEAKWYVVHTYSGYENKVASDLRTIVETKKLGDLIQDIHVPTETVVEIRDNKRREVEKKIFPGYVLVKMIVTDSSWYTVRNVRGCTGFVGSSTKPVPLTEEEVAKLGIKLVNVKVDYKEGDSVRITNSSLKDFIGRVDHIDKEKEIVKVTVSMFGRETQVELALSDIEKFED